ncbi:hypothetical protein O3P69_008884 [Scylla paramamosain]|uniref:Uncharacterized protein n=1 Tax=Scylla paramamosain TaxID=85552 RepID=A0AAW0TP78_SCYPA
MGPSSTGIVTSMLIPYEFPRHFNTSRRSRASPRDLPSNFSLANTSSSTLKGFFVSTQGALRTFTLLAPLHTTDHCSSIALLDGSQCHYGVSVDQTVETGGPFGY